MKKQKLSPRQRAIFAAVARVSRRSPDRWYRAGEAGLGHCRGEAVTLSSLHSAGLLVRQRRPEDQHAWEYRLAPTVLGVVNEKMAARKGPT